MPLSMLRHRGAQTPRSNRADAIAPPRAGGNASPVAAELTDAFHRSVDEGVNRLERPLSSLLATGVVGGLDVSIGVLALLIVERETGSRVLGSIAFGIGFL